MKMKKQILFETNVEKNGTERKLFILIINYLEEIVIHLIRSLEKVSQNQ